MKARRFVFIWRTFVHDEKMCTFHARRFDALLMIDKQQQIVVKYEQIQ